MTSLISTPIATTPIDRLRRHTQEVHERLHHHPRLAMMVKPHISECDYRWFVQKQYGFYAACMKAAQPAEPVQSYLSPALEWLTQDLRGLNINSAQTPLCRQLPRLESEGQWLGFLYVKEGALLGGQLMGKNVAAHLPEVSGCTRYLAGWGEDNGRRWRALTAMLNQRLQGESLDAAQSSALDTFTCFEKWLDQ